MDKANQFHDFYISLDMLEPDKDQPRKQFRKENIEELANNIREHGQIEPIIVTPIDDGKYKIIQGERRFQAYKLIAEKEPDTDIWKNIKAVVIEKASPVFSVISSIVKQELNPMEYAAALERLKNNLGEKTKQRTLANLVGKTEQNISEWLSLNKLPKFIREDAQKNNILPFRKLKQISAMDADSDEKIKIYKQVCKESANEESISDTDEDNKDDKSAQLIKKKLRIANTRLSDTRKALKRIDTEMISSEDDKQDLLKSLDETIEQAMELKQKLEGQSIS